MSIINEASLPGIGRKFWLESKDGGRISIIAYNTGEYEIYLTPKGEEFPTSAVRMSAEEARSLRSALPAITGKITESSTPDTTCVVVPADSPVLGQDASSLASGDAFVAAVATVSGSALRSPGGHALHAADILYLIGPNEDREALTRKIQPHD